MNDDTRFHRRGGDHCVQCREPWPCPFAQPEDTRTADPGGLDFMRLTEARHRHQGHPGPADHLTCQAWAVEVRETLAFYAALTPEATAPDAEAKP